MSSTPRAPRFLMQARPRLAEAPASFSRAALPVRPESASTPRPAFAPAHPAAVAVAPEPDLTETHAAPPRAESPPPAWARELRSVLETQQDNALAAAVERLRQLADGLGEQVRWDALEIGLMVARRILEREVSVDPAAHVDLIRSAIRRVGESRVLTVRVCPADLRRLEQPDARARLDSLAVARVEWVADATLAPGDCIVDGELARIDGRLAARLEEVARAARAALKGSAA